MISDLKYVTLIRELFNRQLFYNAILRRLRDIQLQASQTVSRVYMRRFEKFHQLSLSDSDVVSGTAVR
jgi:hypothetical protein